MGKKNLHKWLWCLPVLSIGWMGQPTLSAPAGNFAALESSRVSAVVQERIDANPAESLDLIVTYKSRPGVLQRNRVAKLGGRVDRSFRTIRAEAISLSGNAVHELADDPDVAHVSLDYPVTGMMNVGRKVAGLPHASSQFGNLTGAGVTVAIIDSGIIDHADLGAAGETPLSRHGHLLRGL